MDPRHRHRFLRLTAAAVVALVVPLAAARFAEYRVDEALEPAWSAALGENLSVGQVHASLTGSVRLEDVQIGGLFRARAIVGSVGLENLLQGRLGADEIRVVGPQIRDRLHRGQESRIAAMLSRLAARRRGTEAAPPDPEQTHSRTRLRRILVNDGQLQVDLFDGGRVVADRVELVPTRQGLRIVTGSLALSARATALAVAGQFERAAADVRLPDLAFSRVLAVGGRFEVRAPDAHVPAESSFDDVVAAIGIDDRRLGFVRGHAVGHGGGALFEVSLGSAGTIDATLAETPLAGFSGLVRAGVDLGDAIATGAVHARPTISGLGRALSLEGRVNLAGARLANPTLSNDVLPIAGTAEGRVTLSALEDGTVIDFRALSVWPHTGVPESDEGPVHPVELTLVGIFELDAAGVPRRADARLRMLRTRCMHALLAIPAPARERLAGLDLRGDIEGATRFAFDLTRPDDVVLDIDIDIDDCTAAHEPNQTNPRLLLGSFDFVRADGSRATLEPKRPGYRSWSSIPSLVAKTFVAAEDARFFEHNGFDARQIRNSLAINLSRGELLRGGSTISQQLVKNMFLTRERTLARKLEEAVLTWRLEQRLSKQQILERYLNIVELGPGVYGVDSGARHWFGRPLQRLQPREVAFLAALTPAPSTLSKQIGAVGGIDDDMRSRVDVILRAMAREDVISRSTLARELSQPLQVEIPNADSNR